MLSEDNIKNEINDILNHVKKSPLGYYRISGKDFKQRFKLDNFKEKDYLNTIEFYLTDNKLSVNYNFNVELYLDEIKEEDRFYIIYNNEKKESSYDKKINDINSLDSSLYIGMPYERKMELLNKRILEFEKEINDKSIVIEIKKIIDNAKNKDIEKEVNHNNNNEIKKINYLGAEPTRY